MSDPKKFLDIPPPTTEQLYHEIIALKELIFIRLDAMDKATSLLSDNVTRVPTDVDKQVGHLKELHTERFESIVIQFRERDTRSDQTSRDSKVAVDAALQAAKEAVGEQNKSSALAIAKSEAATSKQIDQTLAMISATNASTGDKFDDLKERLTAIEGRSSGSKDTWGVVIATIGIIVALIAIAVLALAFAKH